MNIVLTDVLKQLDLQPGERRSVVVDDYRVVIQREEASLDSIDEPPLRRPVIQVQDPGPMVDVWLNVPPSSRSITLVVEKRTPILPGRIEITESDLAPE